MLAPGTRLLARVDSRARADTAAHHTATHLLHATLSRALAEQGAVRQAGSLVGPSTLRFDFTFPRPLTLAELQAVEDEVNRAALADAAVSVAVMGLEEAKQAGATALFGDKYDADAVRVVSVAGESTELCGGTHVASTRACFPFKILSETGVSGGVRRIEALSGAPAAAHLLAAARGMQTVAAGLKLSPLASADEIVANADKFRLRLEAAQREVKQLQAQQQKLMMDAAGASASASDSAWLCLPGWTVDTVDVSHCLPELATRCPHVVVYGVPAALADNYGMFRKVAEDAAAKQYEQAAQRGLQCLVQLFVGENGRALCFKTIDGVDLNAKRRGAADTGFDASRVWKCVQAALDGSKGGGNDAVAQGTFALWSGAAAGEIPARFCAILQEKMGAQQQRQ
jgi:alanyl-tRNA synthetase